MMGHEGMNTDHDTIPAGKSMTLSSLKQEIAQTQVEFRWLNRKSWKQNYAGKGKWKTVLNEPTQEEHKRMVELAEKLSRLWRFHGMMAARDLTERAECARSAVQIR